MSSYGGVCIKAPNSLICWCSLIVVAFLWLSQWGCLIKNGSLRLCHWVYLIETAILRMAYWGYLIEGLVLMLPYLDIKVTLLRLPHWGCLIWVLIEAHWGSQCYLTYWCGLIELNTWIHPKIILQSPWVGSSSVLAVLATFLNSAQAVLSLAHLSPSLFSLIDAASFLWCSLMSSITWKPQLARHLASLLDEKVSLYFIWKYSPLVIRRTSWSRPPYGRPLPASSCRGLACFAHKIARFAHRFARSARNTVEEYK